jgi:hypothetical protein
VHSRPRKTVHRHPKAKPQRAAPKKKATSATPKVHGTLGASVSFLPKPSAPARTGFDLGSLLLILVCGIAITCFSIALIPARSVPWRPAAIFVSERQLDLMLVGLALLVATLTFYFLGGP